MISVSYKYGPWYVLSCSSYPWLQGINPWLLSHMKVVVCHGNVCIMQRQIILREGRYVHILVYWEAKERELIHI